MERHQIGTVQTLFRYPVKSMQGERLREVEIGARGVIGDRAYALRQANGRVMTAKKWPTLLECSARYEAPPTPGALAPLSITLPDGRTLQAQDPDVSTALSAVLGCQVVLVPAQADRQSQAEIDPAMVFGDVPVEVVKPGFTAATLPDAFALPAGTFFDAASIHVVATGTLAHLRALIGADAPLDPRRFRPNIVVETAPGVEGFVEDRWLEGGLAVGDDVKIVQLRPTLRCVMTTHSQADLERDLRILRTAAQHHRNQVGVWASVGEEGTVRVGDPVVLVR
ncbi:MAG TPA: MOSC N-terminal beta barrel domain-containing protein [Alphaproteobacteria bacterium]|nr:MOSC N-terminal beta barrel domain-containing protein [Alphaproteobacteria bacterium]